jgi:hypothetical protein
VFSLSGFNLTLQESGQLDSRIRSTAGLLVKSPAHLSVRHALRATALATASNATDNTTATPIPTPAPSTPSASPSATPTPTTTPSAPTTPVPTSAAAPTNPPATRAPTPEPGPPPYSAAEIKAEFSRMLSHVLSGHTFTAKLAHEGTVLKRDATNLKVSCIFSFSFQKFEFFYVCVISLVLNCLTNFLKNILCVLSQSSLNFAFESFAEQIVQRIFRGVKSKFVSRFRENVKSEVRKNLVSAGTSISTQLQEDVFQYMQCTHF